MSTPTTSPPATPWERDLLHQLSDRWGERVAVKRDELDLDGHFDPALPDFPAAMAPVLALPQAQRLGPEERGRILGAAWISYNAKTHAIEDEVILPACRLMLTGRLPVRGDEAAVSALHQTIIDEHYHILMCHNATGVTRRRRDLADLAFAADGWSVVRALHSRRAAVRGVLRDLVVLAFALAAETTINAFLSTVSSDSTIQPMNRMTVDLHRRDESGHAVVFRELVGPVYHRLAPAERDFFLARLADGLAAFRAPDHDAWVQVAAVGGITTSAEDVAAVAASAPPRVRDTGPLLVLLRDLGMGEAAAAEFLNPVPATE